VVAADFFAVFAEEEGGVVDAAVGLGVVGAADEVEVVFRGGAAEACEHPVDGAGEDVAQEGFVARLPGAEAERVFGEREGVAVLGRRLIDQGFQLGEGLVDAGEDVVGIFQAPVDQPCLRLRRGEADGVGRRSRRRVAAGGV
jgi:hypothetical protein